VETGLPQETLPFKNARILIAKPGATFAEYAPKPVFIFFRI
jgi:hypothetical protein